MATAFESTRPRRAPAVLNPPFGARAGRELLHVVTGLPLACAYFAVAVAMFSAGAGLLITFLGVPVLAAGLMCCRTAGRIERARARALLGVDVPDPEPVRTLQRRPGLLPWTGALLRSGASWRHLLYAVLHLPWVLFSFPVTVTLWSVSAGLAL